VRVDLIQSDVHRVNTHATDSVARLDARMSLEANMVYLNTFPPSHSRAQLTGVVYQPNVRVI